MAVEISLAQFNRIASSEHACVNFTLSKDENTGAITVKYSSPEEVLLDAIHGGQGGFIQV